jgi:hypothetical protein
MFLSTKVHVQWMNLMKNQIVQKFQKHENLKQRFHFFNRLGKKLYSKGSKCLALHAGHMCKK